MGVTTTHPLYDKFRPRWKRSQIFYEGEDAVKAKGEKYLKKTGGQIAASLSNNPVEKQAAKEAYDNYKDRGVVPEVYTASVIGLTGLACQNKWDIQIPPAMRYLEENASSGIPLEGMQNVLIHAGLTDGRLGHFIDNDPIDNELRIALYNALAITNWKNDYNSTNLVVLQELHDETEVTDIFSHEKDTHYRVLRLDEDRYVVDLYKLNGNDSDYAIADEFEMDYQEGMIPFTFQGSTGLEVEPDILPLEGMVIACKNYYRLSADLFHDIHMSNQSTLFAAGFSKDENISFTGGGSIVKTTKSKTEADLKFVSTEGRGQANAIQMMDKMLELAEKQSHRLTAATNGVEASSTLRQKTIAKTASLRSVEQQAVAALEKDLRHIARWKGLDPDLCTVRSHYQYSDEQIEATLFKALSDSVAVGATPQIVLNEYGRKTRLHEMDDDEIEAQFQAEADRAAAREIGMGGGQSNEGDEPVDA